MKNILKSVVLAFVSIFFAGLGFWVMAALMVFAHKLGILGESIIILIIYLIAITIYTVLENK